METMTTTRDIQTVTAEIKMLTEQAGALALDYAVEIGRRLREAREMVERGEWEPYLDSIGYKKSTANNFMRIFDEYGDPQGSLFGASVKSEALGKLTYTKALALLALPEEEREAFAAEVNAEALSTRELREAVTARAAAEAEAEAARAEAEAAARALAEAEAREKEARETSKRLEDAALAAETERKKLEDELRALREKPVEVAVERDEKAEQAAYEKGAAEAAQQYAHQVRDAREAGEKALAEKEAQLETIRKEAEAAAAAAERAREALREAQAAAERAGTAEAAELKRKLELAAPEIQEFKVLFGQWQEHYNKMRGLVAKLEAQGRAEDAGKLRGALGAAIKAMQEGAEA